MNFDIYSIFLIIYILNIFYILKEDLETKYIPLIWFYPFVIFSIIYYYFEFWYLIWLIFIILYLIIIFTLDLIEHFKWPIKAISEKWSFLDTGIYDYFLYLFITELIISHIIKNISNISFIFDFLIIFITTIIIWILFLIIHQKKVKVMINKNNINNYEELDKNLFDRKLKNIKLKEIFNTNNLVFNSEQKELLAYYKNRVPLFLFWNIFILCFIITNYK